MSIRQVGNAWKWASAVALLSAGVLLSAGAALADGTPVYSQPASFPSGDACGCWTSSLDPSGSGFVTFDNFTLGTTSSIGGMTWQGLYLDFQNLSNNPVSPDTNSWIIAIFSNSGGAPGALLFQEMALGSSVPTTLAGQDTTDFGVAVNVYNFDFNFSDPFTATAGTEYWITAVSEQTNFNPIFSWTLGSGGDGESYQCNFEGESPSCGTVDGDRAFSLSAASTTVPEPSSLWLLGSGVFAVLGGLRRKVLVGR